MEQSLKKLGVERLGKEDVQKMQWEVLEAKIGNWIHYMRISVSAVISSSFDFDPLFSPCYNLYVVFDTGKAFICCGEESL